MDTKIIRQLSQVPPPVWKYKSARHCLAAINKLEDALDLPISGFEPDLRRANARVSELESFLVAKNLQRTSMPVEQISKTVNVSNAITFKEWRAMSDADQRKFCRDGGQMARDSFLNEMPPAAQTHYLSCGGKIETPVEKVVVPKTKNPPPGSMYIADFLKLEAKAQSAHFAAGKKVHD
jgi:hypothetical protein